MWDALVRSDCARFHGTARAFHVTYVMIAPPRTPAIESGRCGLADAGFPGTYLRVYRLQLP
jgi:hypothetical protein